MEFIELSKLEEQPVAAADHEAVRTGGAISKTETRRPVEIVTQPKGACGASGEAQLLHLIGTRNEVVLAGRSSIHDVLRQVAVFSRLIIACHHEHRVARSKQRGSRDRNQTRADVASIDGQLMMLVTQPQVQSEFLGDAIIILREEINEHPVLIGDRFGDASSRAGRVAQEKIRHREIAVIIIEAELAVGRKRRLVAQRLIRLDVSANCNCVLAFGDRKGVFVLLHHVVRFHWAIV